MYVVPSVELVKVEELFHLLTLVEFLLVNRFVVRVLKRKTNEMNVKVCFVYRRVRLPRMYKDGSLGSEFKFSCCS